MLTCNCPICGAKHIKRKTTPNTLRNIELVDCYINGDSQEIAGKRFGIGKARVKQIFKEIQMSGTQKNTIIQNLDDGVSKLLEIKQKMNLLKEIQKAAKYYTRLRLGKISLLQGTNITDAQVKQKAIQLAFEQLQEALKNYDNITTNKNTANTPDSGRTNN